MSDLRSRGSVCKSIGFFNTCSQDPDFGSASNAPTTSIKKDVIYLITEPRSKQQPDLRTIPVATLNPFGTCCPRQQFPFEHERFIKNRPECSAVLSSEWMCV